MVNQPGCTYYEGTTKIFDPTMTEAECDALANDAGVWFNGSIMGFQLVISSVGLTTTNSATTSVTGGSALDLVYTINLN
mgnify:CR=1 FL=1